MHPKKLEGLSLGLSFKIFEYVSFEFEHFFESLANFDKDNFK